MTYRIYWTDWYGRKHWIGGIPNKNRANKLAAHLLNTLGMWIVSWHIEEGDWK